MLRIEKETESIRNVYREEEKVGMIYKDIDSQWTFSHNGYIELTFEEMQWILAEFFKIRGKDRGSKVIWTEGP